MKRALLIPIILLTFTTHLFPCTSAIVSGRFTADGRPLMWKHRDNPYAETKLIYHTEGKYDMILLVNANVEMPGSIWYGFNSAGFAIMNTLSYNIEDESTSSGARNGTLMREALAQCATIEEFEAYLDLQPRPLRVRANFGVIDANGGGAYFEVNNDTWEKFDVNDRRVAPHGYIVRTNYSFSGEPHSGAGYIRFHTAENIFYRAAGTGSFNIPFLLTNACRSLENSYTGQDIRTLQKLPETTDNFIYYPDCINRPTSTSSIIVQGVKEGESPLLTTMWTIIGPPLTSMVVPVWLNSEKLLPSVITAPGKETPELCEFALRLKELLVPSKRGSTGNYINTTRVFNAKGTGITQQILPAEEALIETTMSQLEEWRTAGAINQSELRNFYEYADSYVRQVYSEKFGISSSR